MTERTTDDDSRIFSFQADAVADAYRRGAAARAQILAPANELMLDLAGVRPGSRVLDVAAGNGEQTVLAAQRVGPTGTVLATDIAPRMLDDAAEAARQAGLTNVEIRIADAQALDLEPDAFDAAITRMGLMLMPDPAAALASIHRVLRPGGKLAAMVFGPADRNPNFSVPLDILSRHLSRSSAALARPGLFALGDRTELERLFDQAGFRDVTVQAVAAPRPYSSVHEAADYVRMNTPPVRALTAELEEVSRERAWAEIEQALKPFDRPDGFVVPGQMLVAAGTK
jgi:ubiquinone/menaquinone biosynthesis C-methylase UbiE